MNEQNDNDTSGFGLTDEVWDRAETTGRIHDLETRIAEQDDASAAKARKIADLTQQLDEATSRQRADRGENLGRDIGRSIGRHLS